MQASSRKNSATLIEMGSRVASYMALSKKQGEEAGEADEAMELDFDSSDKAQLLLLHKENMTVSLRNTAYALSFVWPAFCFYDFLYWRDAITSGGIWWPIFYSRMVVAVGAPVRSTGLQAVAGVGQAGQGSGEEDRDRVHEPGDEHRGGGGRDAPLHEHAARPARALPLRWQSAEAGRDFSLDAPSSVPSAPCALRRPSGANWAVPRPCLWSAEYCGL